MDARERDPEGQVESAGSEVMFLSVDTLTARQKQLEKHLETNQPEKRLETAQNKS